MSLHSWLESCCLEVSWPRPSPNDLCLAASFSAATSGVDVNNKALSQTVTFQRHLDAQIAPPPSPALQASLHVKLVASTTAIIMSDIVVSPAAQQHQHQHQHQQNLAALLELPFFPEPSPPQRPLQTSRLLSMPPEMRDAIWELTAYAELWRGTHRRARDASSSVYLFRRQRPEDRPRSGRHGMVPFRRFGLVGASRQTKEEYVAVLHRVFAWSVKVLRYGIVDFVGPPRPFAILDVRFVRDLVLDINLQAVDHLSFDATSPKGTLAGPFSVKYTASCLVEDARLHLSDLWVPAPLPPFCLSLRGMLEAEVARGFPHPFDQGFGLQFDRLCAALAWKGLLRSFDLRLVLPASDGRAAITSENGMRAFVSSLLRLRGVKRVALEVSRTPPSEEDAVRVEGALRQACQDAAVVMKTSGQHDDCCSCLECFPAVGHGPREVFAGEEEEEEEE